MNIYGLRSQHLPASPEAVWGSLTNPRDPKARQWLGLLEDEIDPVVVDSVRPTSVVWSSLWPSRPNDQIVLDLTAGKSGGTDLRFTLLTPDDLPDASKTGHIRKRVNTLLFGDLRYSYGQ